MVNIKDFIAYLFLICKRNHDKCMEWYWKTSWGMLRRGDRLVNGCPRNVTKKGI